MYLKERLRERQPGVFLEIGVGRGHLSACLLSLGWTGLGYELDADSSALAAELNRSAIAQGRYRLVHGDWLAEQAASADLILSSMVLEHLSEEDEARYFAHCGRHLRDHGLCVLFVPGSPGDWGIEDEIAGHYRRYGYVQLRGRLEQAGCRVVHMAGLTYPLSNWLLPLSNFLVRRAEERKRSLTLAERTRSSGRRDVLGKTRFPDVAGLVLNEWVLYPFHLLQKMTGSAQHALVVYCEFEPRR
jgi:SAM-dependent methyltransferase